MLLKCRFAAALLLLCLGLVEAAAQLPAGRFDVYAVSPVPVDVTAANAAAARDQAIVEGESRAFDLLMRRMTLAADRRRLPPVDTALLNDLVQGFEVARERRSDVRYLADFTVHFRPEAVRQMLRQAGVGFAETPSKPVIVLAVLHQGEQATLWDDPNPWRDAWANVRPVPGLVPLTRPLGDLEDVQAIDAEAAASGNDEKLQAISQRYGGADVLVTQATLQTGGEQHALDVSSTRYPPGVPGGEQSWVGSAAATPGESDAELMGRAAADVVAQVEEAWKSANILDTRASGTLTVQVPTGTLRDWLAVRDRLNGIPAVRSSRLLSLDRNEARVEIRYVGDPDQLRLALAQRDLELSGGDPDWVLQRRGASTAPPPR
ncbi:MAG TPA: DUF2066 domain-containing protein [Stellaceae bacterium]|nr:DUF2066 domain-containing protein [Stellaceae bacterium]